MSYIQLQQNFEDLLQVWQRDMRRMFLLAALAKENGIDLDWVLKADDATVLNELVKRTPMPTIRIIDPPKMWNPR